MDETQETDRSGAQGPGGSPGQPRRVNLVVVAGAVILIGLVAFALYHRSHPAAPAAPPAPAASPVEGGGTEKPAQGTPITAPLPVRLTPEASIIAERYRCVCSCNDPLNVCTCSKTPGSRDMRQYVQELVNQKKTGKEIDAAMVARYGSGVLIGGPSPAPSPTPARKKR